MLKKRTYFTQNDTSFIRHSLAFARECLILLVAAFAVAAVSEIVTEFVRRFDCRDNHIFGYGEGHIVDALFGDASLCSNDLVFFFGEFFSDDFARARIGHKVVQANGETYFVAEVEDFVKFFFGAVFENELANATTSPCMQQA